MRVLELFSGYGTSSFALKELGLDYNLIGYSDIDKYANECFKNNHCVNDTFDKLRLGDCKLINPNDLRDFELLTGGFPCQSFSIAGKGLGELDTRGTLFNEIIRIAEVKKPRYMMLENVKGLMSKKHKPTFDKIISELYRIGYFVKWKILDTKEHGIPQNRKRVFFTCFRYWNDFINFEFPNEEELTIFLTDILEEEVEEKYYLKDYTVKRLLNNGQGFRSKINPKIGSCLFASMHKVSRGMDIIFCNDRYRKLTPKECFRLQGFLNDEVILNGLSNTQRYTLAGNDQSINVLKKIFKNMLKIEVKKNENTVR